MNLNNVSEYFVSHMHSVQAIDYRTGVFHLKNVSTHVFRDEILRGSFNKDLPTLHDDQPVAEALCLLR